MIGLRSRSDVEAEERERLAPYAVRSGDSAGRVVPEASHPYRAEFQRDRDRIVHARAFRRLEYKTQVFVYHEGDHYRNRLTHTIEAAQITRTIARALRLNEDLAEAIVLAHDLGHTPFGHAGERVLDELMADAGGFDHNRQSLRVVDWLEERYDRFRGLNLTAETRAGMCKHGASWPHPVPLPTLPVQPFLEAQVADLADEIAYTCHDLDDGLRAGLLASEELESQGLWLEVRGAVESEVGPDASPGVRHAQVILGLINLLVTDLLEATGQALTAAAPRSAAAAAAEKERWVRYSAPRAGALKEIKGFLAARFYNHPHVVRMNEEAERVLGDLFRLYRDDPARLPEHAMARFEEDGPERAIADYVAGMTDRFAMDEHARHRGSGGE